MAYATIDDVMAGFRELTEDEKKICQQLLDESAVIIDAYNADASEDAKKVVSCRIVRRAMGDGSMSVPMGATQGSMSAMGYSQSWTISNGTAGEIYLGKLEKKLLGVGDKIGSYSVLEGMVRPCD